MPDEAGKGAILGHQLLIRALLHNLALLNDCRACSDGLEKAVHLPLVRLHQLLNGYRAQWGFEAAAFSSSGAAHRRLNGHL